MCAFVSMSVLMGVELFMWISWHVHLIILLHSVFVFLCVCMHVCIIFVFLCVCVCVCVFKGWSVSESLIRSPDSGGNGKCNFLLNIASVDQGNPNRATGYSVVYSLKEKVLVVDMSMV